MINYKIKLLFKFKNLLSILYKLNQHHPILYIHNSLFVFPIFKHYK